MTLLKEIFHQEGLDLTGRTLYREAVRGIILRGKTLLMIHSSKHGDYKFPGGGVDGDETHAEALSREVREESGATVSGIERAFGRVIEYNAESSRKYDVFKMTSSYYLCHIDDVFQEQRLDQYEKDLGFGPVWIDIDEVLHSNISLLQSNYPEIPRWTQRETFVLEQIHTRIFSKKYVI